MRLIDVDKAIKDLKQFTYDCNLENIVAVLKVIMVLEQQPTAFDVDKVVEQINALSDREYDEGFDGSYILEREVIEIVKAGGIDDNM